MDHHLQIIQIRIPLKPVSMIKDTLLGNDGTNSNLTIPILPNPQKLLFHADFSQLPFEFTIFVTNISPDDQVFENLRQDLEKDANNPKKNGNSICNFDIQEDNNPSLVDSGFDKKLNFLSERGAEAYYISIKSENLFICSTSSQGLFYGFQTLRQILIWSKQQLKSFSFNRGSFTKSPSLSPFFYFPHGEIFDWPDFPIRGISDDVSRGQIPTVPQLKRELSILSQYKINTYALYIEDVIQIPSHPAIGANRGAFSSKEIQEIVEYARKRFITVFPIIETLGHMDNILSLSTYSNLGEFPGAHCFSVANGNIYPFLKDYITEISAFFPKTHLHIGCDEVYDLGHGNSKDLIQAVGIEQALFDHILKVYRIAKENGIKNVWIYHDLLLKYPSILENLPSDITIVYWNYFPKKKFFKTLKKLSSFGHAIVVSPSILNWYRPFPELSGAFQNSINFTKAVLKVKGNIKGSIVSNWGDFGHHSLRPNQIYGSILGNSLSWNGTRQDFNEMFKELINSFYQLDSPFDNLNLYQIFQETLDLSKILTGNTKFLQSHFFDRFYSIYEFQLPKNLTGGKIIHIERRIAHNIENLHEISNKIKSNSFFISYLLHVLQTLEIFTEHLQLKNLLRKKSRMSQMSQMSSENQLFNVLSKKIKIFLSNFSKFFQNYAHLWLKCAKFPNFERHQERFNQVIRYYEDLLFNLQESPKEAFPNPVLKSKYIWSGFFASDSSPRLFRKTFSIEDENTEAYLQIIAGNHAEIYCNDIFVGSANSRFSLSIIPIKECIMVYNITEFLHRGENSIVVEGWNFLQSHGYVNILLQIKKSNGDIIEILSDRSWSVSKNSYDGLLKAKKKADLQSIKWKKAKIVGTSPKFGGFLIHPKLWKGVRSIQDDYFRFEDNLYYFSLMLFPPIIAKFIRFWALLK